MKNVPLRVLGGAMVLLSATAAQADITRYTTTGIECVPYSTNTVRYQSGGRVETGSTSASAVYCPMQPEGFVNNAYDDQVSTDITVMDASTTASVTCELRAQLKGSTTFVTIQTASSSLAGRGQSVISLGGDIPAPQLSTYYKYYSYCTLTAQDAGYANRSAVIDYSINFY